MKKNARAVLLTNESSLLDVVDSVLNHGVVVNGDVILGVANVDLIYVKLSVLLAAIDKLSREPVFKGIAPPRARQAKTQKRGPDRARTVRRAKKRSR